MWVERKRYNKIKFGAISIWLFYYLGNRGSTAKNYFSGKPHTGMFFSEVNLMIVEGHPAKNINLVLTSWSSLRGWKSQFFILAPNFVIPFSLHDHTPPFSNFTGECTTGGCMPSLILSKKGYVGGEKKGITKCTKKCYLYLIITPLLVL